MRSMTRRNLLRGAGGALLALPLLESLRVRGASAGDAPPGVLTKDGYPKRLLILFKGNGIYPDTFWPTPGATEQDFTLAPATEPLAPFREHLLFLDGVDLDVILRQQTPGEAHQQGTGSLLTGWELHAGDIVGADGVSRAGWGKGPSIDQVIAQHVGTDRRLPSLEVGAHTETGNLVSRVINYVGDNQPILARQDPALVYEQLFSDLNVPPSERLVLRDKRVSVLDFVNQRMRTVARAASSEDRPRIERHAEFVRDIERRIMNDTMSLGCEVPGGPVTMDPNDQNNMERIFTAQRDLVLHAFACDLTRVATLMVANGGNQINYSFLDAHGNDHVLAHGEQSGQDYRDKRLPRHTWCMQQLSDVLKGLSQIQEGDGTLLDRTLVLFCSENATGWHSHQRMPFILAGKLDGHFRTGRLVRYEHASHSDLLVSILQAFGLGVETFGNPSFCTGPLGGLTA